MDQRESRRELSNAMYSDRAEDYDNSWHPDYSHRFMKLANVQQGEHILDLACGTGLEAVLAASLIGDTGSIVAVDCTERMLAMFRRKLERDAALASRVQLVQHDITDLTSCPEIQKGYFDLILCSNAFMLLGEPTALIEQWRDYLKPHGRMVIDITHEHRNRDATMLEAVADRLGVFFPYRRRWIHSRDSFARLLEDHGFEVEQVETMDQVSGRLIRL